MKSTCEYREKKWLANENKDGNGKNVKNAERKGIWCFFHRIIEIINAIQQNILPEGKELHGKIATIDFISKIKEVRKGKSFTVRVPQSIKQNRGRLESERASQ